jgi:hypothetical protein
MKEQIQLGLNPKNKKQNEFSFKNSNKVRTSYEREQ